MFSAFKKFGKLGALASSVARAWSPLALWPDGIATPGMWISPRDLTSQWADYTGTTPVATPGTVADSANPVGLALDIRAGAPGTLGPELAPGGGTFDSATGWDVSAEWSISGGVAEHSGGVANLSPTTPILTVGKYYQIQVNILAVPAGFQVSAGGTYSGTIFSVGENTVILQCVGDTVLRLQANTGQATVLESVSVREVPGNHMLQATSAARPLESARVNLLTYSEDFSVKWAEDGAVLSGNTLTETTADGPHRLYVNIPYAGMGFDFVAGTTYTYEVELKAGTSKYAFIYCSVNADVIYVDLEAGTIFSGTGGSIKPGTDGSFIVSVTGVFSAYPVLQVGLTNASHQDSYVGNTANSIEVIRAQVNYGNPTDYQAILTDGSSYSPTGTTPWQQYDGTDDGMATATFSAGTLIDGMDCLIPVRRDSVANCVAGLYNGIADATKFFGMAESASGSGCVGSGAGTPTVWVDNTQLTGGTAVTRGTLHTALTVGDWHILEFRNLDLSTWTAAGFGLYTSYLFPGPRGDILLYPSTTPTTDKDAARQWLADYYGVTLP